jgi:hypothetical protein
MWIMLAAALELAKAYLCMPHGAMHESRPELPATQAFCIMRRLRDINMCGSAVCTVSAHVFWCAHASKLWPAASNMLASIDVDALLTAVLVRAAAISKAAALL